MKKHVFHRIFFMILAAVFALTAVFVVWPAQAGGSVNCADDAWPVGSELELNDAILCFSSKPAGSYTITVTQNISLTTATSIIDTPVTNSHLLVDGNGFVIDGQSITGTRPFDVATNTHVTIANISIIRGTAFIPGGPGNASGGGIRNFGVLTLTNSFLAENLASYGGAVANITGSLFIENSIFDFNDAFFEGGALFNESGFVTVSESILIDNFSTFGGAFSNYGAAWVRSSNFDANEALSESGALDNLGLMTVENITLTNNLATAGGGISNLALLTITNSTIEENFAAYGGGVANYGYVVISGSSVISNEADVGAGLGNFGEMLLINDTVSSNRAITTGGGIDNGVLLTMTHVTVSDNEAPVGAGLSNAVFVPDLAQMAFRRVSALGLGGGIFTPTAFISNSILANSFFGADCANNSGLVNDEGNNLVEDNSCGFVGGVDPNLGPLQDNGGDSFTHALLPDSSAIDAGNSLLAVDQRGVMRPQGGSPDIGAFEFVAEDSIAFLPIIFMPTSPIELLGVVTDSPILRIPVGQIGESFFARTVDIPEMLPAGSNVYLTSSPTELLPIMVDDEILLQVNGTIIYSFDFTANFGVPTARLLMLDESVVSQLLGQMVTVTLKDKYGVTTYSSEIFIVSQ